jgi:hypothetical protein
MEVTIRRAQREFTVRAIDVVLGEVPSGIEAGRKLPLLQLAL